MHEEHINKFRSCFLTPPEQPTIGDIPQDYLARLNELCNLNLVWPRNHQQGKLDRSQLRALCRDLDVHVLIVYAAVMAWGGRGLMSRNYRLSLQQKSLDTLVSALTTLRNGNNSRKESFQIFQVAAEEIKGLGISFYTKLLFFLRRDYDAYILDQFTAKSAQLLFNPPPVRLTSQDYPLPGTTPNEYEDFCSKIEELSSDIQQTNANWTSEKVEQAMFDIRGGIWRKYLKTHFRKNEKQRIRKISQTKISSAADTMELGGSNKRMIALAEEIVRLHRHYLDTDEIELPPLNGNITKSNPLRIHCNTVEGITWQYGIQQKVVHAQVFIPKKHVGRYDRLCRDLDVLNHDFGDGIKGSGTRKHGITRSIKLTLTLPSPLTDSVINHCADKSVKNMAILSARIGEYL